MELCGLKHGERQDLKSGHNGNSSLTLEEIATSLGVSKRDLSRMLEIERKLTPK
ncbi:hypothetical protein [Tissierella pigra]|uniref:hypothetical protein n=1 Tax=Tissierella pigra TaxID=2607614 RepID=UPI0012B3B99E|nr:hypothetical protein [Tissierella pigra]